MMRPRMEPHARNPWSTTHSVSCAVVRPIILPMRVAPRRAKIEPPSGINTSDTLPEQIPDKTLTPKEVRNSILDIFCADSEQKGDSFLRFVCEIYVKWAELPPLMRKAVEEWDSLPEEVRKRVEGLLGGTHEGQT